MSSSVLEYLTNVLSQRGPSAVPYDENVKWNIRDHVSELQKVFPTLSSKLSEYHSNDGRLLHVLKIDGTMPIHYQGAKYNIPILMWLTEQYPYTPPQVFVVPTSSMIIRPSTFVNPSGQVSTPLLLSWVFPSSNLVDVVLEMSQRFGEEPPLYTRPAGYTSPPAPHGPGIASIPQNYPQPHAGPSASASAASVGAAVSSSYPNVHYPGIQGSTVSTLSPYVTPSMGNTPASTPGAAPGPGSLGPGWGGSAGVTGPSGAYSGTSGAMQPPPPPPLPAFGLGNMFFGGLFGSGGQQQQSQPAPPPPPPPPPPGSANLQYATNTLPPPPPAEPQRTPVSREELDVHFRHLAIEALTLQLRALHRGFSDYAQEETVKALEVQNQLNERRTQLQAVHDSLTKERMSTEQLVAELDSKTKALKAWLDRNEAIAEKYDPSSSTVSCHLLPVDDLCRQGMETQARDLALEDTILALDKLLQTGQLPLDAYLKQVRSLCRKQFFSRALGLKVAAVQQTASARTPHLQSSLASQTTAYPIAHGDGWSHGALPPPPGGMQTPGPLLQQPGFTPGPPPRYPGSVTPGTGVSSGPGFMTPSSGMLTNPLAGR
ncbi:hypothetical protein Vafri_20457 [Volvox africanus]|uniref:Uncharacterized protein n=1 Tax=Volvox africanus TaxID=51714 RepID=A0A8J4BQS2_9CHLO|nr:hypothetical protein Vafri_20457 [Volvox africanus]